MAKKILLILADGFEEIEAIAPIDILRRAKMELVTAGLQKGTIKSSRGVVVTPDEYLDNVKFEEFDMLILPGGQPGTTNLAADSRVKNIVQTMHKKDKFIAAICAAPFVLSEAGILQDKKATSYPNMQSRIKARQVITNEKVVVDGKVITSQGAGTAIDFALKLVELLEGKDKSEEIRKTMLYNVL